MLDIAGDYKLFDGTETVTFTSRPGDTAHEVAFCLRTRFDREEIAFVSDLGLGATSLPLHVPKLECGEYVPKAGDYVEDATGAKWTILRVRFRQLTEMYRVILQPFKA